MKIYTNKEKSIIVGEKEGTNDYIVKYNNSFYRMTKDEFTQCYDKGNLTLEEEISENPIIAIASTILIVFTIVAYFAKETYVIIDSNFVMANILLLFNVFIHEMGHVVLLKIFYKSGQIKVGFKMTFIYPSFYVDTSDSYLLPTYKRISVYLGGNLMNCIYLLVCLFFFPFLNKYNYIIVSTVLVNFLPIVKSDGYYAIMSLIGKYNIAKSKAKNYAEDMMRGFAMFVFLLALSKISF